MKSARSAAVVDGGEAAVAPDHVLPGEDAGVLERIVVLGAAEHCCRVGRVRGDAGVELGEREVRVERLPGSAAIGGTIDAAVIAGVQGTGILRIPGERVLIDVDAGRDVAE